jgi:cytochrome P450
LIKWGEQFQDVFMLHVGPRRILILNSERAISDLYDKRGAIYSSRPLDAVSAAFFSEKSTAFTPSGKMHRWARSLINETFGPNPSKDAFVKEMIEREAGKLVNTLKSRSHLPGFDLVEELGRTSISTVWAMIYAGETVPHDQVPRIAQALRGYSKVSGMGSRLVSLFPFLARLGAQDGDIRAAREARQNLIDLIGPRYSLTLERVKRERLVEAGQLPSSELDQIEPPCHARSVAEAQLDGTIDEERALWLIVGLLSASIDSTGSSLHWALSFVAENPRVQRKAHETLDQAVGHDRPPNFTDTGLEYIRAIIKESTRLWPVSPTGMPRMTDEDDIYNGYFIPKGTTVMMNLRHLSFDDSAFDNARVFEPERWLRPGATLNLQDRVKPCKLFIPCLRI